MVRLGSLHHDDAPIPSIERKWTAAERQISWCARSLTWEAATYASQVGKQVRVVSYYRPEAFEQLQRLAAATRVTQSVYLREALDDLLKKYAATLRKSGKQ